MHSLKLESETAVKWFSEKKMVVNLDKFKAIIISKSRSDHKPSDYKLSDHKPSGLEMIVLPLNNPSST